MEHNQPADPKIHSRALLELLSENEERFPTKTAERYPHVIEKLVLLWPNPPAMRGYLQQLLLTRREQRAGFPQEIYLEIVALNELYDQMHELTKPPRDDFWSWM